MKVLIATKNPSKFSDIKNSLIDCDFQFVGLSDLGIKEGVEETGKSFEENAKIKAIYYAKKSGLPTIADDGGLEIDVFNGEPGVKTRRWIGPDSIGVDNKEASDEQLIKYCLLRMKRYHGNERKAQLRVVVCLGLPSGKTYTVEGKIKGVIAEKPFKTYGKGFPFDGLLYFPNKKKYYYQLKYEDNISINHRAIAIQKLKSILKKVIQ